MLIDISSYRADYFSVGDDWNVVSAAVKTWLCVHVYSCIWTD